MASTLAVPATNRLLASLPSKDREHLLASCELVELRIADVLGNPGEPINHVYFPTDSIISLVMPLEDSPGLEVRMIGNEGMLGISLVLGVEVALFHALVQRAGGALRIAVPSFLRELDSNPALQRKLKRYLYVSISQLAQTATCNRFHQVQERLARLLLMIRDRVHLEEFHITHELLAQILGVRRVGVTKAAGWLQKQDLISYSRGDIKIHDVIGLEAASCSCYISDKEMYDRILHC